MSPGLGLRLAVNSSQEKIRRRWNTPNETDSTPTTEASTPVSIPASIPVSTPKTQAFTPTTLKTETVLASQSAPQIPTGIHGVVGG